MAPSTRDHVVLVDDDEQVLRSLARTIGAAGFRTTCYRAGDVALERLVEDAPTVILSDYMMPRMDGVAFLRKTRELLPDAARILCTAFDDFDIARDAVNASEVFRIVSKPWRHDELVSTVRQAAETVRLRRENQRLMSEVQSQNDRLREMNRELERIVWERSRALLEGLIAALDFRDSETQWHSRRVSLYARRLARQLGIAEPELSVVEHGALLHDLGKIGIPDAILLKPGPLSEPEWAVMREHVTLGSGLLQRIQHLQPAATIVLHHHERWDGTGYPAGLEAEAICMGARVFHVVDTFDAITSARPYRKARSFELARAEIVRCRGTQLDPRVVDAFLKVPLQDWLAIRDGVEMAATAAPEPSAPAAATIAPGAGHERQRPGVLLAS